MSQPIPGYDSWKTTPPKEPSPVAECCCGQLIYPLEEFLEYDGETYCSTECLMDNIGVTVTHLEKSDVNR